MESELNDLKILFQQKKPSASVQVKNLPQKAEFGLTTLKKELLKTSFIFLMTAFAVIYIDKISSEKMQTSVSGFWILLSCSFYYAVSRLYLLYKLNNVKPTQNVLQTIVQLESYKALNTFVLSYGELVYVMVLSLGVYLYLLPMKALFADSGFKWVEFALVAYIVWVAFHSLVIKRKKLKNEERILEQYILALSTEQ